MEINLSEEQLQELYFCTSSPEYFINNYQWIEVKEKSKIVPFVCFDYQNTILNWLIKNESGVVLKSRRVGASTIAAAYVAWLLNFRRGVNVLLLSENELKAKELLIKVKFALKNIAKHDANDISLATDASWMLNPIVVDNQQQVSIGWFSDTGELESTSTCMSLTTTSRSGAGFSATFVLMDEFAFLDDQEGTMRAARLTTLKGGHYLIVSTPNGAGDVFHSLCLRGDRNENETYNYLRVHWSDTDIDENMIKGGTEGLDEASVLQELEMEFISSGDPVFNPTHLAACYKPPGDFPEVARALEEYRALVGQDINTYYFSGVDTAVGKLNKKASKRDYHSFTALTKSGIQAFAYHTKGEGLKDWAGNVETLPAVGEVRVEGTVTRLHREYPGFMQIEENGPGQMTVANHVLPEDGFSVMRPVVTTAKSKGGLGGYIAQLVIAVESHSIIITDKFTYQCMLVYQRGTTPGSFSAPNGDYYDDPVISLALAYDGLLRHGKLEFPWGNNSDGLQRQPLSQEGIERESLARLSQGPALLDSSGPTDRLSESFNSPGTFIDIGSDLDINRIKKMRD